MAAAEITRSATEQPDVNMDCIVSQLTCLANRLPVAATAQPDLAMDSGMVKLEIHVSFNNGMWWAMPHELSDDILQQWIHGAREVSFVWDVKTADGAETTINRYIIDFDTMYQRNTDNNRLRQVKVVSVLRQGNAT